MKKILFLTICCLCLCGCENNNNWKNKLQMSELKLNDNYITGEIKNLTDRYYDLTITLELKNGSIVEEKTCYHNIKPEEKNTLSCYVSNISNDYSFKIKKIEFDEKEIPEDKTYKDGDEISVEALEYYKENIYHNHTLSMLSFSLNDNNLEYPYIDKITYKKDIDRDTIKILYSQNYENLLVDTTEEYNFETQQLEKMYIFIGIGNISEELRKKVETKIYLNPLLTKKAKPTEILRALTKEMQEGYCNIAGDWCISRDDTWPGSSFYSINLRD